MADTPNVLLGLDLGTGGVRAALYAIADGRLIASATSEYELFHPHPNWAEQNPEDWWLATIAAVRACVELGTRAALSPGEIAGMAISGQMHGAVLLDRDGDPVRPCIIWADQRSTAQCQWITERIGAERLIDLTCNPALPAFTAPKALWVRDEDQGPWKRTRTILLPKDYIRYRLTGDLAIEISDAAGSLFLDVKNGVWSSEFLAGIDLGADYLPPVKGAVEVCGHLTEQAAVLMGLPPGLPVAGGGADNACGATGAGVVKPGLGLLSIGTSGVLLVHSATPAVDRAGPTPRVHTFNHAVPGAWYLMGVTQSAGLSLRWFRDNFGQAERGLERFLGEEAYDILTREAGSVPPGSAGLLYLPYLQGERTPHLDTAARGGWIGLTSRHDRRHLIRALLEGVAYSLRDCLEAVRASGVTISELRATGGGLRSPLWRQILADVLGMELIVGQALEGPAFGAALLAGVAVGAYPSVEAACETTMHTQSWPHVSPDPDRAKVYDSGYTVYKELYPALRTTMHRLGELEK